MSRAFVPACDVLHMPIGRSLMQGRDKDSFARTSEVLDICAEVKRPPLELERVSSFMIARHSTWRGGDRSRCEARNS